MEQKSLELLETTPPQEYNCSICKDEGGFITRKLKGESVILQNGTENILKNDMDVWVECSCSKVRKINSLIKSSEITEEFQQMGFNNFSVDGRDSIIQTMKEKCLKYYESFNEIKSTRHNSVLLIGQPGSGKTHLLTAIANNLIQKKVMPVMYFPFRDGINEMSANSFEKKASIISRMKYIDVLFIDDLFKPIGGKVEAKSWQVEIIFEVVNYRYLNNKPILISSELSLDEMLYVDEALASRIIEMSEDYIVTIKRDIKNNYRLKNVFGG